MAMSYSRYKSWSRPHKLEYVVFLQLILDLIPLIITIAEAVLNHKQTLSFDTERYY